jgi:hypothetical protein
VGALALSITLSPGVSKADDDVNVDHLIAVLQHSLLDLEPNQARYSPELSISKYEQNRSLRLQDISWVYTVPAHPVTAVAPLIHPLILRQR